MTRNHDVSAAVLVYLYGQCCCNSSSVCMGDQLEVYGLVATPLLIETNPSVLLKENMRYSDRHERVETSVLANQPNNELLL
jgi:hypothetical protein